MITIRIKTDNAAFADDYRNEVARILRHMADQIEQCRTVSVRDANGNRCGSVKTTGPDKDL